ncbi:MAG: PKD domain-containing protein [bacterium]|nr:PKD domain-containing protein [bacterium]
MRINKIYILFLFISIFSKNSFSQDSFDLNDGYFVQSPLATIDGITTTDVTDCYGGNDGTITIGISGGVGAVEYSIDGPDPRSYQSSNIFTGLPAGFYTIYVSDGSGVTSSSTTINQPSDIIISNEVRTNVTGCYGDATGTLTITASGGTGALEYSIENPVNFVSNGGNFAAVTGGDYTVRVRDANNCIKTGNNITVSQPLELTIPSENKTDVSICFGNQNGTIDITASGGTQPLNYSIDNGTTYQSSNYFSGLDIGSYDIVVRDNNNCITNGNTIIINQPAELIIDSEGVWDVNTCNGYNDGSITITASGGTGTIQYSIGGLYNIDNNFPNLNAGSYDVSVRDQNYCITTGSTLIINEPTQLTIDSENQTDISQCFGDLSGEIEINASGGTPGIEYSIDNGITYQAGNTFTGLASAGYQVKIRDANACETTGGFHYITQPNELIISGVTETNVTTCFGGNNGTFTIVAYGGTGTIEYQANALPYQTNNMISNLTAGDYNIRIRDANNCVTDWPTLKTITEPVQIVITGENPTNPKCFAGSDGQIEITSTGGIGTIYYSVNGGTNYYTDNIITGLSAGTAYQVMVRDGQNCTITGGIHTLTEPADLIITSEIINNITSCHSEETGSIVINASGGTAPISYTINGGADYQLGNSFSNLASGNYQIMVKDNNNCITIGSNTEITQPQELIISNDIHTDILGCNGANLGTITLNSTGGTAPITYYITGSTTYSNNTGIFTNLPADVYNTSLEDTNGCISTGNSISIDEPEELILSLEEKSDIKCNGDINGSILLSSTGGQLPHQFSINGGTSYTTSTNFNNLTPGSYTTFVKDIYNCIQPGQVVVINEPSEIQITNISTGNITQCFGDATGSITITATGGTPDYTYSVNTGASYNTNSTVAGLTAGNYNIIVRDKNSCTRTYPTGITISEPPEIEITAVDIVSISCLGDGDGSINITSSGGTGTLEYSIETPANYINNGGSFLNLESDVYQVSVKDDNNCLKSGGNAIIYEPTQILINNVNVQDISCIGENDGRIIIFASGGTAPYEYNVNAEPYQSTRTIENLSPGDYTPYVRDNNGCDTTSSTVTIGSPVSSASFTVNVNEGCSPLEVEFSRETDGKTYLWEFGDGNTSTLNEPTHIFINSTDAPVDYIITSNSRSPSGCYDVTTGIVHVEPQPALSFTTNPTFLYYPDATVSITNTSQSGYTDYQWDFGDGTGTTNEHPGSHTYQTCGVYDISVSALNTWCSDTIINTIEIDYHPPEALFDLDTTNGCTPLSINITNQSNYTTGFEWIFGDGTTSNEQTPTHTYDETGSYNLILNVTGHCGSTASYDTLINVWKTPYVDFNTYPDTVMLPKQPIHCYNYSISEEPTYLWDLGDGTTSTELEPLHFYTEPGFYQVTLTVTSMYGCVDSLTLDKYVIVLPAGNVEFPDAFTPNSDGANDVFKPGRHESVSEYHLELYNRWGEKIFDSNNIEFGWNGYYQGLLSIQDVYIWKATGKYLNGEPFEKAGNVTLLR